jgi:hypothetical protein
MPATQPKHTQPYAKIKWLLIISGAIGVLILIGVIHFAATRLANNTSPEQQKMTAYLNNKYGQNFIVKHPIKKSSGLGSEGFWESVAYARDAPDIIFTVETSSVGTSDQYLSTLWQHEELERLKPAIAKNIGEVQKFELKISTPVGSSSTTTGKISTFNEAASLYGRTIFYHLTIYDSLESIKDHEASIANKVLSLKNALPYDKVATEVDYLGHSGGDQSYELYYGLALSGDKLNSVRSSDDLITQFKTQKVAK